MKRAIVLIAAAAGCVLVGGAAFTAAAGVGYWTGVYWAVTTATTVGYGDVIPHTAAARVVAVLTMLTTIPLLAAAFGVITSAHLRKHMALHHRATVAEVQHELDDVRQHTRKTVDGAARYLHRRLDDHEQLIRAMAGTQGQQPGADPPLGGERVVPPAAARHEKGGM